MFIDWLERAATWFDRLLGPALTPSPNVPTVLERPEPERPTHAPAVRVREKLTALGVGVDEYLASPENRLRGAANDARNVRQELEALGWIYPYGLLVNRDARRHVALERIGNLAADLRRGEIATLSWSSHGVLTFDALEPDVSIEALCPYDSMQDWPMNLITWRDLAGICNNIADGALLVVLSDACHSSPRIEDAGLLLRAVMSQPQEYRRAKSLIPPAGVILPTGDGRRITLAPGASRGVIPTAWTRVILWSGCASNETSADAFEDNDYTGAMTWSWRKAIRARAGKPLAAQHAASIPMLKARLYAQDPQLVGAPVNVERVIYGSRA